MNPTFIDNMSWRMAEVYGAVTDRILINLAHHFQYIKAGNAPSGSWDYQVRKLAEMGQVTKETEQIILEMLGGADGALQKLLEDSIRDALKDVEKPLRTAAEKGLLKGAGMLPPEVDPHQMQAFKAFYEQSADKLNFVNTVMLESTQAAYTATVADIANRMNAVQGILNTETGGVVTGVTTLNQAIRSGVQRMVKTGITGYIDHGGHHWSPEAYVAMDVRTTMANASREAVFERNEQYGNDLYQVSHHNGARPLCYPWQGKVISRDDLSREVEDDEGNKVHVYAQSETTYGQAAGLFGVNCKHYPIPFVPGFSRIRPPEQDKKANDKEYAESQQQRALERNYRYEKRDLAVLKAQGAPEEEIKAQRERVKTARNNLDDFCEETGRARRTGREGTPIKASFPPKDSYDPDEFPTEQRDKMREFFKGNRKTDNALDSAYKEQPPTQQQKPKTVQEYDAEIERLRSKRQALFDSESYDKKETDSLLSKIFSLEDERSKLIASARPDNEQEVLKQFKRYDPARKTEKEKLKQVNPNFYSVGSYGWTHNCQRTVAAQELIYRGYDVTALPRNGNDPVKSSGIAVWKVRKDFWNDPEVVVSPTRGEFVETMSNAFQKWGEGSRGIVRVQWTKKYGGSGHFLFARNINGKIVYTDPQNGETVDIAETLKKTTTARNQMWCMRVDNREVNDNIVYAAKNVEDSEEK